MARDFLYPNHPDSAEVIALKKIADTSVGTSDERNILLATCKLIDDLRWANRYMEQTLQHLISNCPLNCPQKPFGMYDDGDERYFEEELRKYRMAEGIRKVLNNIKDIK